LTHTVAVIWLGSKVANIVAKKLDGHSYRFGDSAHAHLSAFCC